MVITAYWPALILGTLSDSKFGPIMLAFVNCATGNGGDAVISYIEKAVPRILNDIINSNIPFFSEFVIT